MKQYHSPTDWQSFITRKDIQSIARKLKQTQTTQFTVAIELLLVIVSVSFSNIFVEQSGTMNAFWLAIAILALIPFIIMFIIWLDHKAKRARTKRSLFSNRDYIDMFDNELCYYIMMAQSFYAEYLDLKKLSIDTTEQARSTDFCFLQTTYYLNKTVDGLCSMQNDLAKVFTSDKHYIALGKMVALVRLTNVLDIITFIYTDLQSDYHQVPTKLVDSYKEALAEYIGAYNFFLAKASNVLGVPESDYKISVN